MSCPNGTTLSARIYLEFSPLPWASLHLIHTHTHTCAHTSTHVHVHTHVHACMHAPGLRLAQGSALAASLQGGVRTQLYCMPGQPHASTCKGPVPVSPAPKLFGGRCSVEWPPWHPHSAQGAGSASAMRSDQHQASLSRLGPLRSPPPPPGGVSPRTSLPFSPADRQKRSAKIGGSHLGHFLLLSTLSTQLSKWVTGSGFTQPSTTFSVGFPA